MEAWKCLVPCGLWALGIVDALVLVAPESVEALVLPLALVHTCSSQQQPSETKQSFQLMVQAVPAVVKQEQMVVYLLLALLLLALLGLEVILLPLICFFLCFQHAQGQLDLSLRRVQVQFLKVMLMMTPAAF